MTLSVTSSYDRWACLAKGHRLHVISPFLLPYMCLFLPSAHRSGSQYAIAVWGLMASAVVFSGNPSDFSVGHFVTAFEQCVISWPVVVGQGEKGRTKIFLPLIFLCACNLKVEPQPLWKQFAFPISPVYGSSHLPPLQAMGTHIPC